MRWWLSKHTLIRLQASMVRLTFAERMRWKILHRHIALMLITCHWCPPRDTMPHIGPITDEMFDRYVQRGQHRQQLVRPTPSTGQTGSPQPVRPVLPLMQHQTSILHLLLHSQILRLTLRSFLLNVRMIWLR